MTHRRLSKDHAGKLIYTATVQCYACSNNSSFPCKASGPITLPARVFKDRGWTVRGGGLWYCPAPRCAGIEQTLMFEEQDHATEDH